MRKWVALLASHSSVRQRKPVRDGSSGQRNA